MSKSPKNKRISAPKARTKVGFQPVHGEIAGVVALGLMLFVTIGMIALQARALWMGPFGRSVASLVYGIGGITSYALVALGAVAAVRVILEKKPVIPIDVGIGVG